MPGLAMPTETIPDNYSNDDKGNEGFALPLVGRRRKASEAGFRGSATQNKRQNLQNTVAVSKSKDEQLQRVEMKRTQSH